VTGSWLEWRQAAMFVGDLKGFVGWLVMTAHDGHYCALLLQY